MPNTEHGMQDERTERCLVDDSTGSFRLFYAVIQGESCHRVFSEQVWSQAQALDREPARAAVQSGIRRPSGG